MVEELSEFSAGEFETVAQLLASSSDLQALMVLLGTGLVILGIAYRGFGKWMSSKKFSYTRPHVSRFARTVMLAFFGIGLVTGVNLYMQIEVMLGVGSDFSDEAIQTFEKIINTINILVIGYTISHLIPIGLNKAEKTKLEAEDFENWKDVKVSNLIEPNSERDTCLVARLGSFPFKIIVKASLMANVAITTNTKLIPSVKFILLKVNLVISDKESCPTVASIKPRITIIIAFKN